MTTCVLPPKQPKRCWLDAQEEGANEEVTHFDPICGVCNLGGSGLDVDLLCCDSCLGTFHKSCLNVGLEVVQGQEWYCPLCRCSICSQWTPIEARACLQCQRKFHKECVTRANQIFCSTSCESVHERLSSVLGEKIHLEKKIGWMLLKRGSQGAEKLEEAENIFKSQFYPIIDPITGVDVISKMVYSINNRYRRLDFSSFYTAVILIGDKVASTVLVRIHGKTLAEIPLAATSSQYQRQGMCKRLVHALESLLVDLGVQRVVLPVTKDAEEMWRKSFMYDSMDKTLKARMVEFNLVTFGGVESLQKMLQPQPQRGFKRQRKDDEAPTMHKCKRPNNAPQKTPRVL